jgi:hypothetical protein
MKLAVYTTIYPGVEPYLQDWYRSLCGQADRDFALWIGLDSLEPGAVQKLLGADLKPHWVVSPSGATAAQIRQQALQQIVENVESTDAVVLVDSDDVLHFSRTAAARAELEASELVGCALRVVDLQGRSLGFRFGLPPRVSADSIFPRNNVYGFSNSAYRSELLRRCLPIPAEAVLVDWFLATRAWLLGAKLGFDPVARMDYRQHPANTARVRYPVSCEQVASDTALVLQHFQLLSAAPLPGTIAEREEELRQTKLEIEDFQRQVVEHPAQLEQYVAALNALRPPRLWWTSVANPALDHMWSTQVVSV